MSHYDNGMFDSSTNAATTTDADAESYDIRKWRLGDHAARPTVDKDALRADADRNENVNATMAELLDRAADFVESASLNDFECPVCGLSHGHGDKKHDIRPTFSVLPSATEFMEFQPNCHCGVSELAMLMDFFGYIAIPVFEDEDEFEAFTELMPSDEAQMALDLYWHPDTNVRDVASVGIGTYTTRQLANGKYSPDSTVDVSYETLMDAARLPNQEPVREAFRAYTSRIESIRSAANAAPIPSDTENRIESIRSGLEAQFE